MTTVVDRRGYCFSYDMISKKELDEIKNDLIVYPSQPKGFVKFPKPMKNLRVNKSGTLILPKWYGIQRYGLPTYDKLSNGYPIDVEFHGELSDIQREAVDTYIRYAEDANHKGGIVSVSCGIGKTVLSLYLIAYFGVKTLVLAHKNFLMRQWENQIKDFLPGASVGIIQGKKHNTEGHDIVIASLSTLRKQQRQYSEFGFVIVDEVHHMAATTFAEALPKINFRYSMGLSATVERSDRLEDIFKHHIGDIVYHRQRDHETVWVIQEPYDDPNDDSYKEIPKLNSDMPNVSKMVNNVCNHDPRTRYIANIVSDLAARQPERRIIVFSERRGHLNTLHDYIDVEDIGFCVGGMSEDAIQRQDGRNVVLCTYSMASEGLDMKSLDTIVFASPKKDIEQSIGRILRKPEHERTYVPLVIDIIDQFGSFRRQADERRRYYKKEGYTLIQTYEQYIQSL